MRLFVSIFVFFGIFQIVLAQTMLSHKKIEKDSVFIDFINPFYAHIEVNIQALDSTKAHIKVTSYKILKYKDTLKNALIIPLRLVTDSSKINPKQYIDFNASFGDPKTKPDDSLYILPYPKGKRYKIIQSFGGNFSHNLESSYYAIDFGTQIGDTITAARGGKVIFVKEDSKEHCRSRKCMNKANKILVLQSDGTIANYVHLDFEGALVDVGDYIKAEQPIGISGMTGFTTIPHLHFVVHKARGKSIPVYFKGMRLKKLKKGKYYRRTL